MSMESFGLTSEQKDVQEERKIYEDQTKKDARKANTVFENLTGRGIDKEDGMRVDAEMEDAFREELNEHPDEVFHAFNLDRLQKSALTFEEKVRKNPEFKEAGKSALPFESTFTFDGLVSGRKVAIEGQFDSPTDAENDAIGIWNKGFIKITGEIDGKHISKDLATEIARIYFRIARERSKKIEQAHKDQPGKDGSFKLVEQYEMEKLEREAEKEKYKDIL